MTSKLNKKFSYNTKRDPIKMRSHLNECTNIQKKKKKKKNERKKEKTQEENKTQLLMLLLGGFKTSKQI